MVQVSSQGDSMRQENRPKSLWTHSRRDTTWFVKSWQERAQKGQYSRCWPRWEWDSRSKWAMPSYGYGHIKRSAVRPPPRWNGAKYMGWRAESRVEYDESPFTAKKMATMILYANCLRYPNHHDASLFFPSFVVQVSHQLTALSGLLFRSDKKDYEGTRFFRLHDQNHRCTIHILIFANNNNACILENW